MGGGPGVVVRTYASNAADLGSNPIPEALITKHAIVTTTFGREVKLLGPR